EWWNSAVEGYDELRSRGYDEIAVAGVSLGGIFSLRLGEERPIKAIVTMSAPALSKSVDSLQQRVISYTINYKKLTGTFNVDEDQPETLARKFRRPKLEYLPGTSNDTSSRLDASQTPVHVLRGLKHDGYDCE